MAKIVVIIPTYNEAENTSKMIDVLARVFEDIKDHEMHLLYVDANSPDGTAELVRKKIADQKPWLHLLVEEKKEGLGMAYAKGMTYAMKELNADYLMEFDADFQHRPSDIPRLIAEVGNGLDYIIGSRYVPGGSIPKDWGFKRKFLSVVGNIVGRTLLITQHIHDVTTGFKLAKVRGFMDQFDFSSLISKGFAYKVQLLHFMVVSGAKVKEVPIEFQNRTSGESKIAKNESLETLKVIFKLQLKRFNVSRFTKFGAVGFIGYIVNALFLLLFSHVGIPESLRWALATEMAVINNFTLNNQWVFTAHKATDLGSILKKFLSFNLTSVGSIIIQSVVGTWATHRFGTEYRQLILPAIILFLVMPYNYAMYTLVIWKKKNNIAEDGKKIDMRGERRLSKPKSAVP